MVVKMEPNIGTQGVDEGPPEVDSSLRGEAAEQSLVTVRALA